MARQGVGRSGTFGDPGVGEEVEALFDAILDKAAVECRVEEIDPSRDGWEIFLRFEDCDPRIPGTEASADFKTLSHFINLGIARCEYKSGTKTVVISPLEGCCDEEFPEEYVLLMQKYNPRAKAPQTARRAVNASPESATGAVAPPAGESASRIIMGMKSALLKQAPVIQSFVGQDNPPVSIIPERETAPKPVQEELVVPEDILLEIPLDAGKASRILDKMGCKEWDDLIAIIQRIADEEELLFQHSKPDGEDGEKLVIRGSEGDDEVEVELVFDDDDDQESGGTYMINIYKDPKIKYRKPMDDGNMAFIHKLQEAISEEE